MFTILLYGATGYSGRLIAEHAARTSGDGSGPAYELIMAGRDGEALAAIARDCRRRFKVSLSYKVFGLDDRDTVMRNLRGVDVVLNAASPFDLTAPRLAKAALGVRCHYVDINGEVDVYKQLDDLGPIAKVREVALVCGAGHLAAVSDCLLDDALDELKRQGYLELGSVRIAMNKPAFVSRGSARSALRTMREQVVTVRNAEGPDQRSTLSYVPAGYLERTFDFSALHPEHRQGEDKPDLRIASAVNLVDTLVAQRTLARHGIAASRIESYMALGPLDRAGYQFGATASSLQFCPISWPIMQTLAGALPEGPTSDERAGDRNLVIVEIEDIFNQPIWYGTKACGSLYEHTAELVLKVCTGICAGPIDPGWVTPAQAINPKPAPVQQAGQNQPQPAAAPDRGAEGSQP